MKALISAILLLHISILNSQVYPTYGPEISVSINGLTFDAMEPFISADGNYLFFNNLNDGINTKLYYATIVNDSTFNYVGEVNGTNQTTAPYLDGVADVDALNNFYWTSTRNYPAQLNNLFYGKFDSGDVSNIGRVQGDFNKNIPGWLVMDHGISHNGEFLYYNNARFNNFTCQGPCETELGIAKKANDHTFNKIPLSDFILGNINDENFIYYAPCISRDNLELYYTRFKKGAITVNTLFEICVAVRDSPTAAFSVPKVLFSEPIGRLIEAPTLTTDKRIMYYHRKTSDSHKIVMRYRENPTSSTYTEKKESVSIIYPNPTYAKLNIKVRTGKHDLKASIFTAAGEKVIGTKGRTEIDVASLSTGTYFLRFEINGVVGIEKFVKLK